MFVGVMNEYVEYVSCFCTHLHSYLIIVTIKNHLTVFIFCISYKNNCVLIYYNRLFVPCCSDHCGGVFTDYWWCDSQSEDFLWLLYGGNKVAW